MADIYVTMTFVTCIPFTEDIPPEEVTIFDAYAQLQDDSVADILDEWTLVRVDTSRYPAQGQVEIS